jgi:prophage regulatory protein
MNVTIDTSPNRHERRRVANLGEDQAAEQPAEHPERILREPECQRRTGLSRSTRWRLERAGLFPRKRRIAPNCCGWLESEIDQWIADRAKS